MDTLLLDTVAWDLTVDANGNIAKAQAPYALAQDVSSQCRLFQGELWYDTTQGIPYWQAVFGQMPPLPYLKTQYQKAALLVPDVQGAQVFIADITQERVVTGQVQIVGPGGEFSVSSFGS